MEEASSKEETFSEVIDRFFIMPARTPARCPRMLPNPSAQAPHRIGLRHDTQLPSCMRRAALVAHAISQAAETR